MVGLGPVKLWGSDSSFAGAQNPGMFCVHVHPVVCTTR